MFSRHNYSKQHRLVDQSNILAYPSYFTSSNRHEFKSHYRSFQGYLSFIITLLDCKYVLYHIDVRGVLKDVIIKILHQNKIEYRS